MEGGIYLKVGLPDLEKLTLANELSSSASEQLQKCERSVSCYAPHHQFSPMSRITIRLESIEHVLITDTAIYFM